MKEICVVTGSLRSGTSCIVGLLERCGFDLGRNVRILRKPTEHNLGGHFEPDLLFAINSRLLGEAGTDNWSIFNIPEEQAIAELASRRENYFKLFIRKFDGELCKDPLFCLTLPFWEQYWKELKKVVFCLRHPLAVAQSMEKRYGLQIDEGLKLWYTYSSRFFRCTKRSRVYVFDFDTFRSKPCAAFSMLLDWLERPMKQKDLQECIDDFFKPDHVHWSFGEDELKGVPVYIRNLHLELLSRTGPRDS